MRALALLMTTAGLALAGCNTMTDNAAMAPAAPMADTSNSMMASGFVPMAASSDQFEIQSSQLALQMSANSALKNYADMMIAHHQQTSAALAAAAQGAGLPPPPTTMLPHEQQMMDQLRAAGSGQAFDDAYKAMQIQGHQAALLLNQGYASGGDVPALRQAAGAAVPVIQQHLAAAQALNTTSPMMSPGGMSGMPMNGQSAPPAAPIRSGERG